MDSLLVSVIIPVYNVVPWLAECLDSVIMQTYSKLEILVIDDGSTDESGTICDEYAGKDQRIKVIHQNHNGLSVARNTGLDLATGEIITFLDADDMMYAYAIERIVTIMEKVSIRILVFGAESYYNGKIISSPKAGIYDRKEILESYVANKGMAGAIWTKVFHASVFQDLRFREGHNYADMPVFLTASEKCGQVYAVPDRLVKYRKRPGSITTSCTPENLQDEVGQNQWICDYARKHNMNGDLDEVIEKLEVGTIQGMLCVCSLLHHDNSPQSKKVKTIYRNEIHQASSIPFRYIKTRIAVSLYCFSPGLFVALHKYIHAMRFR